MNTGFIVFVLTFIFSRIAQGHALDGVNVLSQTLFFGGILAFGGVLIYVLTSAHREKDKEVLENFKNIYFSHVFIIAASILAIFSLRLAIRFFIVASILMIPAIIYAAFRLYDRAKGSKDDVGRIVLWIGFAFVGIALLMSAFAQTHEIQLRAQHMVPSPYNHQWHHAMDWVDQNTPEEAIFAHWWDYGYWVQTLGNRATLADGQYNSGWITHNIARYILTTPNPDSALSMFKSYNVSYLLIDSSDVGKYGAYSSIGSGSEGGDRRSWIPVIPVDEGQSQQTQNGSVRVYSAGSQLDGDIVYDDDGERVFLPEGRAFLGGIMLEYQDTNETRSFQQPTGVYFYRNQRYDLPIRYIYFEGRLFDFGEGIEATLRIIPSITQNMQVDELGALAYLSEKTKDSLFAQLYLMNDPHNNYPTIQLAHKQDDFIIESVRQQGVDLGDFVYFQGLRGPIKIWDTADIPEDVNVREELLYPPAGWNNADGPWAFLDDLEFRG